MRYDDNTYGQIEVGVVPNYLAGRRVQVLGASIDADRRALTPARRARPTASLSANPLRRSSGRRNSPSGFDSSAPPTHFFGAADFAAAGFGAGSTLSASASV